MALIPGILAGGTVLGSLIGGLFSSSSTKSTNATNIQLQRETNQLNREMFNQQLAFNEDMWNKTNAYNAPAAMVKRLQAAGINPALANDFGTASMPSAPSAPTMQAAHVDPVDYSWLGNAISTGTNAYFNNNLTDAATKKTINDAQISKVKAELDTKSLKDQLVRIANDSRKSEYEREQARIQLSILDRTQEDAVRQASWQTKIQEQQYEDAVNRIAESKLRQRAQEIANEYAPRLNQAALKQYNANVAQLYASAKNQDAQSVESHARKLLVDLEANGVRLSNQQKDDMYDAIVDEAWNKADESYWNAQQAKKAYSSGTIGKAFGSNSWDTPASDRRSRKDVFNSRLGRSKNNRVKSGGVR